jgi:predicted AAA+ superfamily ATPase
MNRELIKQVVLEQRAVQLPASFAVRTILSHLETLRQNPHIIILKGMRRCGKSTVMHYLRSQLNERYFYLNFDDDRLINFTVEDFQTLLEIFIELYGNQQTIFFDEIQNISGWERFVRRLHETGYKVYLTGSNAHLFSHELGTHLTGRYIALELFPFSFHEFLTYKHYKTRDASVYTTVEKADLMRLFHEYEKVGGIPDYVQFSQPEYLKDLYDSILYRDIIVRYGIDKEDAMKSLGYYLASHVGKEVSFNQLKIFLNLASATTDSDYCSYLENSYLSFFIHRYDHSLKKQRHYGKKQYFVDTALADKIGFRFSEDKGRFLENIVFLELKRRGFKIYYHQAKKECDFLVVRDRQIVQGIQVTAHLESIDVQQREFDGIEEAMSLYQLNEGLILTESTEKTQTITQNGIEKTIHILPIWKWLLMKDA